MNLQMLNAVGPGVAQGQQQAAQLADMIQQHQIRQQTIADAARAKQATAWMGGGGLAQALGGLASSVPGGASPSAMPGPLPSPMAAPSGGGIAPPPPPAPPIAQSPKTGTGWGEPTVDKLTRLLIGEAGGEDDRGQLAVAAVVRNRANQSGLSLDDVIAAPSQFEPYGNKKRWGELQSISQDNPAYIRARMNALRILQDEVEDPTGGADHFYSPSGQKAFGRPTPEWDNGTGVDMGRHRFFKLGYKGHGVPRTNDDGTSAEPFTEDAAASTPEAQSAAMGHPSEPDYGQVYSPMDQVRMTMQLADFIGSRYKEMTGQELAPDLLMDQVDRVAKLSNQFTGAQRLAVQTGVANLRAATAIEVQGQKSETSIHNTNVRTGTQLTIAQGHDQASRDNTGARVAQSDTNNRRSTEASRDNTRDRVAQSDKNSQRASVTSRANTTDRNTTSRQNTTDRVAASERNTDRAGQSRVDAARVNNGKEPADSWQPEGLGTGSAPKPKGPRVDPLKPPKAPTIDKGAAGPPGGTVRPPVSARATGTPSGTGPALPDPKGVAEGTVLRARGKTPGQLGKPQYRLENGRWKKL